MDDMCDDFLPFIPGPRRFVRTSLTDTASILQLVTKVLSVSHSPAPESVEMLVIVRELQKQVDGAIPKFRFEDPITLTPSNAAGNDVGAVSSSSSNSVTIGRKDFSKKFF